MKFSLHISAAPYSTQTHATALKFAEAIANSEHELQRVFFSGDAVAIANMLTVIPQDEEDLRKRWQALHQTTSAELIICVSASLKHGVLDQTEADRYDKVAHNVEPPFVISGLGQLVDACIDSDRVVTFGH